jgi:uncharacterized protein (TIGR00251 family)
MPSFLEAHGDGIHLAVKLQPRASKNEIVGAIGNELKIKVTAPPVESAANEALLQLIAQALDCPPGAVQLVRGHTSRHKHVFVRGVSPAEAAAKLLGRK